MFKCGEAPFQGERACENPVTLSVYDGLMELLNTGVNIWWMLDWIVRLADIHFLGIWCCYETLLWLAGMNYWKIRTHSRLGETRNYILEAELKMDADCWLTTCQLAAWIENAVKLELYSEINRNNQTIMETD